MMDSFNLKRMNKTFSNSVFILAISCATHTDCALIKQASFEKLALTIEILDLRHRGLHRPTNPLLEKISRTTAK